MGVAGLMGRLRPPDPGEAVGTTPRCREANVSCTLRGVEPTEREEEQHASKRPDISMVVQTGVASKRTGV